ncbi:MAG: NADH-dependent dehydrogenase [Candidatus Carbobacillus altaicus]|uniref:NADH-dependent dehydrogenase n=1 Tax=Candidatus Carbonibacillus altaicus TaxID=2163959 RepID=A0A2R6Y3U3_9BACL|nr:MAG: NADH-dependent dehydrogenase [Candidatus Carbobacillus altaicus]
MIGVLLVGAGIMGRVHASYYRKDQRTTIVGVVDVEEERGRALSDEFSVPYYNDLTSALRDGAKADVVDICVPTVYHYDLILQALESGKHVIVEKPLTRTLKEAEEVIARAKRLDRKLLVGHVVRFFPEYRKARDLIAQGAIGEVKVAHVSRVGPFPKAWRNWYADYMISGGVVLDLMIHDIDFLLWTFGDVVRIYAKGLYGREYAQLDYALVTFRFQNGVIAHLEGSWAHETFRTRFDISGTDGVIAYDSTRDTSLVWERRPASAAAQAGVVVPESPLMATPYERELKSFIDSLSDSTAVPAIRPEDAYEALRLSILTLEALRSGDVVEV